MADGFCEKCKRKMISPPWMCQDCFSATVEVLASPAVPAQVAPDWPTYCTHGKSIEDDACEECQKADLNYRPAEPQVGAPQGNDELMPRRAISRAEVLSAPPEPAPTTGIGATPATQGETITMKMRGRPITHEEAEVSAQRLINSFFHNDDGARISIPVRPDNDDVLVMDYILEQRDALRVLREERDTFKEAMVLTADECNHWAKQYGAERESRKQAEDALRDVLEILKKKVPGLYVESRQIAIALLEEALSKHIQEPTGDGE